MSLGTWDDTAAARFLWAGQQVREQLESIKARHRAAAATAAARWEGPHRRRFDESVESITRSLSALEWAVESRMLAVQAAQHRVDALRRAELRNADGSGPR